MTGSRTRLVLGALLVVTSCGGSSESPASSVTSTETPTTTTTSEPLATSTSAAASAEAGGVEAGGAEGCADVVDGSVSAAGETFTVAATVRSADTGDEKYADRWEVRTIDGEVLGERVLTHPHVNEQPFTRSLTGVVIPQDVDVIVLAAHDSVAGFCGAEFEVAVVR